jgi:hypothetical protein
MGRCGTGSLRAKGGAEKKKERVSFYNSALDILFFQLAIYRGFFFCFLYHESINLCHTTSRALLFSDGIEK